MSYVLAILMFGVVIFVHELGHFLMARLFGMDVLVFSIGFGPKVWSMRRGKTEYKLGLIPVGGYVRLAEDEDEIEIPGVVSYEKQAWHKKLLMTLNGSLFNALLAYLIFWALILAKGEIDYKPVVGEVLQNSPAEKAGIKKGDEIIEINGEIIERWSQLSYKIKKSGGRELLLKIKRGEILFEISVKPELKKISEEDKFSSRIWMIGIAPDIQTSIVITYNPFSGFLRAGEHLFGIIKDYIFSLKVLFTKEGYKEIGGPISVGYFASRSFEEAGIFAFLTFSALISLIIGFFNLFPVPPLDGFLCTVFLLEGITGKRPGKKTKLAIEIFGIFILVILFFLAFYNDILRVLGKL